MSEVPAYSRLAAGYDAVMEHVDYDVWARHIHEMLRRHAPRVRSVIELGCGTGAFARAFQSLGRYYYRGTDGSDAMVAVARERSDGLTLSFDTGDFREPIAGPPADAILLLYDGLNYLLELADIAALFEHVHDALVPGGVFIVDQSTPANSLNHGDGFDDAGETDAFSYVRSSVYDSDRRLHTTTFRMSDSEGETVETHVQRAYEMQEIERVLEASPLEIVAAYDEFELQPADASTERIHWVAQRIR